MHILQLMLTTYLYVAHSSILSEPLRNNPFSPPEELKKENKKPQVFRYLDLTNQQALSGLSPRMQWSLPPLSTLSMNNTDDSTAKWSFTLGMEEVSGAVWSPCPVMSEPKSRRFFPGLSQEVSVNQSVLLWRGWTHLPLDGGKVKRLRL